MTKLTTLVCLIILSCNIATAQSPSLVEDYILGPQGSIDSRIYEFQNTLTYLGTTQNGERAILRYDKSTDEISVLAKDEDFDGNIISLSSNTEEMVVFTGDGASIKNIYKSFENDFSDITNLYNSGEAILRTFRFYEEHTLLFEENFDDINYTTNIKVIFPDGSIETLYEGLPGRFVDYLFTATKNHFIIAPEIDMIDGNAVIAYSLQSKSIVPFTDVVPAYESCGLLTTLFSITESLIYWSCDSDFMYDLNSNQFINYNPGSFFINYDVGDHLYVTYAGGLYKLNKSTGEEELIIDQIITFRGYFSSFFAMSFNDDLVDLHYIDFEDEILHSYPSNYSSEINYRLTAFGVVPSGVHMVIYEQAEDNGIIARINAESFTEIDSVFNVNFRNRPVAYEEDIYFTHQSAEFGNELFIIDYDVTSTKETHTIKSIKIFPNPAQDYINIEHTSDFAPVKSSIIDLSGKVISTHERDSRIDISHFSSGIYFLQTMYENGSLGVEKFVVE